MKYIQPINHFYSSIPHLIYHFVIKNGFICLSAAFPGFCRSSQTIFPLLYLYFPASVNAPSLSPSENLRAAHLPVRHGILCSFPNSKNFMPALHKIICSVHGPWDAAVHPPAIFLIFSAIKIFQPLFFSAFYQHSHKNPVEKEKRTEKQIP